MTSGEDGRPNGRPADENTPLVTRGASSLGNMGSTLTTNSHGQKLSEDERAWVRWPANFVRLTWLTLASNYVNVLLVCVPAGIVLGALDVNPTAIFVVNFFAIVPLAALLSFATEELSVKLGQTIGGLMNATFGNAVELIVSPADTSSGIWRYSKTHPMRLRYPLLRSTRGRFESSRLACLARSCRTSCLSLAVASSRPVCAVESLASTRLLRRPCHRSWQSLRRL